MASDQNQRDVADLDDHSRDAAQETRSSRRKPFTDENESGIEEILDLESERPTRPHSPEYEQIAGDNFRRRLSPKRLAGRVPSTPPMPKQYTDRRKGEQNRGFTLAPEPPPVPPRPFADEEEEDVEHNSPETLLLRQMFPDLELGEILDDAASSSSSNNETDKLMHGHVPSSSNYAEDQVSEISEDSNPSVSSGESETPRHPWRRRPISLEEGEIVENWKAPRPPPAYEDAVPVSRASAKTGRSVLTPPMVELRTLSPDAADGANGVNTINIPVDHEYTETSLADARNADVEEERVSREAVYSDLSDVPDVHYEKPKGEVDEIEDVEPKSERSVAVLVFTYLIAAMIAIGILLILILVPMTFKYLDYYRVGLKEQKSTGEIDEMKTYMSGRHGIGPDYKFREFYGTVHMVSLENLEVTSTEKLEFVLNCTFQYFLKPDELGLLFEKYDDDFEPVIESVANAAVKNAATEFSIDEFIQERRKTEESLHRAVRLKLGGNCCPKDPAQCEQFDDCETCSMAADCDKGLHVDVRYFQLGRLEFTEVLLNKYITQQLILIHGEMEVYQQEYAVALKVTEALKEAKLNEVREINENATATSERIVKTGEANAFAVLEAAHSNGLQTLYQAVGATTDEHKTSLNLLFTVDKHPQLYMGTDYNRYLRTVRGFTSAAGASSPSAGGSG
ncbi:uncharacterized protein [Ptychodera flava]|uniref:uncharacterized protein isoform X2 n=1 Tax=Ptychodera flava TaxID=63121 RepID=UPI00396A8F79